MRPVWIEDLVGGCPIGWRCSILKNSTTLRFHHSKYEGYTTTVVYEDFNLADPSLFEKIAAWKESLK